MKIYLIRHHASGKVYIGQTRKSVNARWAAHIRQSKLTADKRSLLHHAISKYGSAAFSVETLILDIRDEWELNQAEIIAIRAYRSTEREYGYNVEPGGFIPRKPQRPYGGDVRQTGTKETKEQFEKRARERIAEMRRRRDLEAPPIKFTPSPVSTLGEHGIARYLNISFKRAVEMRIDGMGPDYDLVDGEIRYPITAVEEFSVLINTGVLAL